ncbi:MAG: DUF547 domain-containing protein [Planctomycetota bacterium]
MAKGLVVLILLSAALAVIIGCGPAESERVAPVEVRPESRQPQATVAFHDKCADTLKDFVNDKGMVDYKRLRRKRYELGLLLEEFGKLDPAVYRSWPEADRIAFWINTYNLQKLKVVVDNYPITPSSRILAIYWGPLNLRHIEGEISGHRFLVMGEQFGFAEIEERFFRGEFDDPRVFFALTSASLSSPPLRNEPYYGRTLDPLAFKIDKENGKVHLSATFELSSYGGDIAEKFATDRKFKDQPPVTRAALNFITNYIGQKDVSFLESGNYTVKYMKHDWTINDSS